MGFPKDFQTAMPPEPVKPPSPKQADYLAHLAQVASTYERASLNLMYSDATRAQFAEMAGQLLVQIANLMDGRSAGWKGTGVE